MAKQRDEEPRGNSGGESSLSSETLAELERALRGLRYGTVTISVQDGGMIRMIGQRK